jgi:hypothetical protein
VNVAGYLPYLYASASSVEHAGGPGCAGCRKLAAELEAALGGGGNRRPGSLLRARCDGGSFPGPAAPAQKAEWPCPQCTLLNAVSSAPLCARAHGATGRGCALHGV